MPIVDQHTGLRPAVGGGGPRVDRRQHQNSTQRQQQRADRAAAAPSWSSGADRRGEPQRRE
jgi:hypothetical protein